MERGRYLGHTEKWDHISYMCQSYVARAQVTTREEAFSVTSYKCRSLECSMSFRKPLAGKGGCCSDKADYCCNLSTGFGWTLSELYYSHLQLYIYMYDEFVLASQILHELQLPPMAMRNAEKTHGRTPLVEKTI